jgi:hypothetical protein
VTRTTRCKDKCLKRSMAYILRKSVRQHINIPPFKQHPNASEEKSSQLSGNGSSFLSARATSRWTLSATSRSLMCGTDAERSLAFVESEDIRFTCGLRGDSADRKERYLWIRGLRCSRTGRSRCGGCLSCGLIYW